MESKETPGSALDSSDSSLLLGSRESLQAEGSQTDLEMSSNQFYKSTNRRGRAVRSVATFMALIPWVMTVIMGAWITVLTTRLPLAQSKEPALPRQLYSQSATHRFETCGVSLLL